MIRRVTRRPRRRRPEARKGAALERGADLWPFLLAAGLAVAALTAVQPWLDRAAWHAAAEHAGAEHTTSAHDGLDHAGAHVRQPAEAPQLSVRVGPPAP